MIVAIGADHGGYELKKELIQRLGKDYQFQDMGALSFNKEDDYPDFVLPVAKAVVDSKAQKGILICGSGVGACMAANKVTGIRAAICHDTYSAHQGVEHDDMNILCLGARVIGIEVAVELANAFLKAKFTGEERHCRRLNKALEIERSYSGQK